MDTTEKANLIDKMCKKYDRKDYPGIAIAVINNGEVIFKKGYGEANLDYNIPIDENTVFHGCSMTKQFTAACIAILIEQGKLSLDDDLEDILPKYKDHDEKIKVYNLLYMTNGIPDAYSTANFVCGMREDEGITRDEFWKYINACKWNFFKPGEMWSYGNTGYLLLGEIVEAVSGKSLSQFADENIFKPLNMSHTFIRDDHTKIIKNRATGYSNYSHMHFNDKYKRYTSRNDELSINEENVEVGGAGQIWTTLDDFILWYRNFYDNKIGKGTDKFIKFLTTSGKLNNGEECGYGCGLFLDEFYGYKLIYHGGWAGGYSAYFAQLPETRDAVIVFGNHTDFMYDFMMKCDNETLVKDIFKLLIGCKESKTDEDKIDVPETHDKVKLDFDLCGEYICEETSLLLKVKTEDGQYYIEDSLGNNTKLIWNKNDTFKSVKDNMTYMISLVDKEVQSIKEEDSKESKIYYPVYRRKSDNDKLKKYEGTYCCKSLGVSYVVKSEDGMLFIKNTNAHNNSLDLYYTLAVNDTFISDPNDYTGNNCVTFKRDSNKKITSLSYRDPEQTLRENFVFLKIK